MTTVVSYTKKIVEKPDFIRNFQRPIFVCSIFESVKRKRVFDLITTAILFHKTLVFFQVWWRKNWDMNRNGYDDDEWKINSVRFSKRLQIPIFSQCQKGIRNNLKTFKCNEWVFLTLFAPKMLDAL